MSASDRPDLRAFKELETLVRHLGEELAAFRRRAIAAEAQLKDDRPSKGGGSGAAARGATQAGRSDLETENDALKARLGRAEDRVRQMMERVRFLRQQLQSQTTATGAGRS